MGLVAAAASNVRAQMSIHSSLVLLEPGLQVVDATCSAKARSVELPVVTMGVAELEQSLELLAIVVAGVGLRDEVASDGVELRGVGVAGAEEAMMVEAGVEQAEIVVAGVKAPTVVSAELSSIFTTSSSPLIDATSRRRRIGRVSREDGRQRTEGEPARGRSTFGLPRSAPLHSPSHGRASGHRNRQSPTRSTGQLHEQPLPPKT